MQDLARCNALQEIYFEANSSSLSLEKRMNYSTPRPNYNLESSSLSPRPCNIKQNAQALCYNGGITCIIYQYLCEMFQNHKTGLVFTQKY